MAGLDGIKNKIEPPAPVDKDLYELPPEEARDIPQVPGSLADGPRPPWRPTTSTSSRAASSPPDLIETWIDFKRENEIDPIRAAPAPARVRAVLRRVGLPLRRTGGYRWAPADSMR